MTAPMNGNRPRDFTLTGGHRRRRRWRVIAWAALAVAMGGVVVNALAIVAVAVVVALAAGAYVNR